MLCARPTYTLILGSTTKYRAFPVAVVITSCKSHNNFNFNFLSVLGCGHCKKAKPEFMDAAKHDADNNKAGYSFVTL